MKYHHIHIPFLTLSIAVSATIVALYAYMFYATSVSVHQANLARDIVQAEGVDQSQAKSLSELATSSAASRARLASLFVPVDNVVIFITALESLGSQSGSKISLTSVDADSLAGLPTGTIGAVRAHLSASGPWVSVMRALALAERLPYAISIDHVELNASTVDPTVHRTWDLSFDIQAATIVSSSRP
jgi:hypothetical protein